MSASLPPPRRIVTSNLPIPVHLSAGKTPEPAVEVLVEDLAQIEELGGIICRGTVFTHENIPTSNDGRDVMPREITNGGLVLPNGANIRFNDVAPGQVVPMHRTQSTDYDIILNGSIHLLTPSVASDGTLTSIQETVCNAGDVVFQRGTMHAWENRSSEWVRWVAILLGAERNQVEVEGKIEEKVILKDFFGKYIGDEA
ncbi:uncharacterized protein LY89DRAFT_666544 [Mollisia scopiformis]|uniref:Uncharacterized protein n=1 Tax=Mollisia scopiformis TaxID=149040 RepID=A0A194XHJ1_MOLSC|nr:uncharacterized protein LY89DRAFT_666544 [Mollisia scopiformis]KUJ19680.1 hypothetical protein LY89DRAFT_666544 [Mollisia scopiformis]